MMVPPPTGLKTLETPRPFIAVSLWLINMVDMKSIFRLGQIPYIENQIIEFNYFIFLSDLLIVIVILINFSKN